MLTLYVKTGCPFCKRVLSAGEELGITFELKNVADEGVAGEMVALGGERQEPFLVDNVRGVQMYESNAIISYLMEHYGSGK